MLPHNAVLSVATERCVAWETHGSSVAGQRGSLQGADPAPSKSSGQLAIPAIPEHCQRSEHQYYGHACPMSPQNVKQGGVTGQSACPRLHSLSWERCDPETAPPWARHAQGNSSARDRAAAEGSTQVGLTLMSHSDS